MPTHFDKPVCLSYNILEKITLVLRVRLIYRVSSWRVKVHGKLISLRATIVAALTNKANVTQ